MGKFPCYLHLKNLIIRNKRFFFFVFCFFVVFFFLPKENCHVIFQRHLVLKYESIPVHRPLPSCIHPALQLHTSVAQTALAGQLALSVPQSVFNPSAFTVKRTFIALLKHVHVIYCFFSYFCSIHILWVHVRTASPSTQNLCFGAKIRKKMYICIPLNAPVFFYIKVGYIRFTRTCFPDGFEDVLFLEHWSTLSIYTEKFNLAN